MKEEYLEIGDMKKESLRTRILKEIDDLISYGERFGITLAQVAHLRNKIQEMK